jgi:ABC-type Fe3+ transport system permease subunit
VAWHRDATATSGITQIHKELEEAAAVSGAGVLQMFTRVLLPLLAPIMIASWIYVFVLAVRELSASVFLVGPGTHVLGTISLTMWEEGGSYGAVSALGVIQIMPLIAIVALLRWLGAGWKTFSSGGVLRSRPKIPSSTVRVDPPPLPGSPTASGRS